VHEVSTHEDHRCMHMQVTGRQRQRVGRVKVGVAGDSSGDGGHGIAAACTRPT
jgi:hypothetical protein